MPRKSTGVRYVPDKRRWRDTSWTDRGLCRKVADPEMFGDDLIGPDAELPKGTKARRAALERQQAEAKAVCWTCPVREACLVHALAIDERRGIRGGFDAEQRKAQRQRQLETAA